VVLGLVASRWPPLQRSDRYIANSLDAWLAPHVSLAAFWRGVTTGLQPLTWEICAVVAAVLLLWRARRPKIAVFVLLAVFGTVGLYDIVKPSVGRSRPVVTQPLLHAYGASFPSGHAMTSMAAMVLAVMGVRAVTSRRVLLVVAASAAALIAAAVAASRLLLAVHYLSDVLGGWLLTAAWLLLLVAVFDIRVVPRSDAASAPARLPGEVSEQQ
jgi:undecaprenyl-diphosphatase